ncbi:MAG TPA: PQQ-dependent sugar dehydrogenase, partial [Phnomibacter sp.]|nr:PQQ-dependent sugar dehydrogenase [Phnomibacter sp.]
YSIPPDNPYAAPNDGVLDEIYAFGLRNPWRWSFDRTTGNAWIADVGQNAWEELNFNTPANLKGANYGWRCYEGQALNTAGGIQPCTLFNGQPHHAPVYVYPHDLSIGGRSVTGGMVYRGDAYATLQGHYIMADYVTPAIWLVRTDGSFQAQRQTAGVPSNISGFGESANGELWAVSLSQGRVYSIRAEQALSASFIQLKGAVQNGRHQLWWTVNDGGENDIYELEVKENGENGFRLAERSFATGSGNRTYTTSRVPAAGATESFYRIRSVNVRQQVRYSAVVRLSRPLEQDALRLLYMQGGNAYVQVPAGTRSIAVSDLAGRTLSQFTLPAGTSLFPIPVIGLRHQPLIITAVGDGGISSIKYRIP